MNWKRRQKVKRETKKNKNIKIYRNKKQKKIELICLNWEKKIKKEKRLKKTKTLKQKKNK